MFLQKLSCIQQKIFLGLAKEVVEADSKILLREKIYLKQLSDEIGSDDLVVKPNNDLILDNYQDKPTRIILLIELIGLAYSDGDFAKEEDLLIFGIAELFGVPRQEYNKYVSWVRRFTKLFKEAQVFFQDKQDVSNENN